MFTLFDKNTTVSIGIEKNRSVQFHSDAQGTQLNYQVISNAVTCMRSTAAIPDAWAAPIEQDYQERNKKHDRRHRW